MNDAQLVLLTLAGNPAAFDFLVDRYWPTAIALCLSRIDRVTEAEDLAQEGFIQAYQNLQTLKDPSRFAGWLTRIMQRKCTDYYRASSKSRHISLQTVNQQQVALNFMDCPLPGLIPYVFPRTPQARSHLTTQRPHHH